MKFFRRQLIMGLVATTISLLCSRKLKAHSLLKTSQADRNASSNLDFSQIYDYFEQKAEQENAPAEYPPLLYWGKNPQHENSPFNYREQREKYYERLQQVVDEKLNMGIQADDSFSAYPKFGELPKIDEKGLNFLSRSDKYNIKEACVCLGTFSNGEFKTKWLGRNALKVGYFWSAAKIVPLTYVFSKISKENSEIDFKDCFIVDKDKSQGNLKFGLINLAEVLISYEKGKIKDADASSNSIGAMFQRFNPQIKLEEWLKNITGNCYLIFRGKYGEKPFIDQPNIISDYRNIMEPDSNKTEWLSNELSAYDLTRIISMIGWHQYLPEYARLPHLEENGYKALIPILGIDPARLTDLAIEKLGLDDILVDRVILSKLGNGFTSVRERFEAVYLGLIQFRRNNQFYTLSMCLRGSGKEGSFAKKPTCKIQLIEEIELDARMATEVTRILNKVLSGWK